MNNQTRIDIAVFSGNPLRDLWILLGVGMLLWAVTSLNTVTAMESTSLEDLLHTSDFRAKKLGYENLGGHNALVIKAEPKNKAMIKSLGYAQIRAWYDTVDKLTRKIVLLDAQGNPLSTVLFKGMKTHKGKNRATHMEVTNHRTGQVCNFEISNKTSISQMM